MDYKQVYDDGTVTLSRSDHGWHLVTRPAVTTLLVTEANKIIVIKEKKDSTQRWVVNCPGGMIEPGEDSVRAAARECEEELGLIPTRLEKFTTIMTDFPDTFNDYYLGSDLEQGEKAPWIDQGSEEIEPPKEFSWPEVYEMAMNTEFSDPRLVVAILQLAKMPDVLLSFGLIDESE